jgi:hypothetical protein
MGLPELGEELEEIDQEALAAIAKTGFARYFMMSHPLSLGRSELHVAVERLADKYPALEQSIDEAADGFVDAAKGIVGANSNNVQFFRLGMLMAYLNLQDLIELDEQQQALE